MKHFLGSLDVLTDFSYGVNATVLTNGDAVNDRTILDVSPFANFDNP
jgi:alpha-D-ribose 1-methylphosphonate 5-phosphate C-P lyase